MLRAGYGWFYQRFTVPNSFGSTSGAPYLITPIHENGVNQAEYTVTDPTGYKESSPGIAVKPPTPASGESAQTTYNIAKNFHAATDMQAAIGIDRQLRKQVTGNLTWLYSRGAHQYLTNNIGAPAFSTAGAGTYPGEPLPAASANLMQLQSVGVYRQNQIIATASAHYPRYSLFGFYTYSNARGDTSGVTWVPSVAQDPGLDYGRTSFDIHHRVMVAGNVAAPLGISFSPMFVYNSGTPYNITTGSDLTGNNQFNAWPTFADPNDCHTSSTRYVSTQGIRGGSAHGRRCCWRGERTSSTRPSEWRSGRSGRGRSERRTRRSSSADGRWHSAQIQSHAGGDLPQPVQHAKSGDAERCTDFTTISPVQIAVAGWRTLQPAGRRQSQRLSGSSFQFLTAALFAFVTASVRLTVSPDGRPAADGLVSH